MESNLITKKSFKDLLSQFGIKKGDIVCLQAYLNNTDKVVINEYQSLIEGIQEVICEEGCLIIPSFTTYTLDPSNAIHKNYEYEDWDEIRKEMIGFNQKLSVPDIYRDLNNQFRQYKSTRSTHPVYSFTYWGTLKKEWLTQEMNYPVSLKTVLRCFTTDKAYNLLIGESIENSVLLPAIAKTLDMGITEVQKAYMLRNHKNTYTNYLNLKLSKEDKKNILDMCYIQEEKISDLNAYCLTIQK